MQPVETPRSVSGFIKRQAKGAHGVELNNVVASLLFPVISGGFIVIKNFAAGLSWKESALALVPIFIIKIPLGYFYRRFKAWVLSKSPEGWWSQLAIESAGYTALQCVTFAPVMMLMMPHEKWPWAMLVTFLSSVVAGRFIGLLIEWLSSVIEPYVAPVRSALEPYVAPIRTALEPYATWLDEALAPIVIPFIVFANSCMDVIQSVLDWISNRIQKAKAFYANYVS